MFALWEAFTVMISVRATALQPKVVREEFQPIQIGLILHYRMCLTTTEHLLSTDTVIDTVSMNDCPEVDNRMTLRRGWMKLTCFRTDGTVKISSVIFEISCRSSRMQDSVNTNLNPICSDKQARQISMLVV